MSGKDSTPVNLSGISIRVLIVDDSASVRQVLSDILSHDPDIEVMGVAADLVARLLVRYRWIAWIGLLIVLLVAMQLIWKGGHEVAGHLMAP